MTPEQFLEIGKVLGVPAAVAATLLLFFGSLMLALYKGSKWVGIRLFGDNGMVSRVVERHVQFLDASQRNDERHADNDEKQTASLGVLSESTLGIRECLDNLTGQSAKAMELAEIHAVVKETHAVVKETSEGVKRLEERAGA